MNIQQELQQQLDFARSKVARFKNEMELSVSDQDKLTEAEKNYCFWIGETSRLRKLLWEGNFNGHNHHLA